MNKKTCDSFFCTRRVPKKYRFCYQCAKSKGLLNGGNNDWAGWLGIALLIILVAWIN
jgi:hypothetical protein